MEILRWLIFIICFIESVIGITIFAVLVTGHDRIIGVKNRFLYYFIDLNKGLLDFIKYLTIVLASLGVLFGFMTFFGYILFNRNIWN